jgi:hypothetical protein
MKSPIRSFLIALLRGLRHSTLTDSGELLSTRCKAARLRALLADSRQ